MSSASPLNGAPIADSKSAKKRKAKAAAAPPTDGSSTPGVDVQQDGLDAAAVNGADSDSPFLKELQKNLRNANKKLTASAKAQSIADENPEKTLDELVASKKMNNDQKAQLERKPALQQQIKSFEDQIERYRQFGKDYEERFEREKATIKQAHEAEITKVKEDAATEAKIGAKKQQEADMLVLTQFLHAASAKRNDDSVDPVESKAFEGVLLNIYQGSALAIEGMTRLVTGSETKVTSIEGEELDFTFAQVKQLSIAAFTPESEQETAVATADDAPAPPTTDMGSDPTIAHAGLTELDDNISVPINAQGEAELASEETPSAVPGQASIDVGSGNAVAEAAWDPTSSAADTGAESWVEVPRDPTETDTGVTATPADTAPQTNSWAEEAHEHATAQAEAEAENDGFQTVQHHVPREGRGRGGRGGRGEFRGRGRGGRGGRGGGGEARGGRGRGEGGQFRGRGRGERRGGPRAAEAQA